MRIRVERIAGFISEDEFEVMLQISDGSQVMRETLGLMILWLEFGAGVPIEDVSDFCAQNGLVYTVL